jgi:DNA-binding NarL/FixJ family response regulator
MDTILSCAAPGALLDRRPGKPLQVMIVEDSARIRWHIEEALGQIDNLRIAGHAETEAEALVLLQTQSWDLVLLDLQLKQGNGLGVLKTLHADAREVRGKVAVFTNYGFAQYRERSMQLGADYFFDKSREFHRMLEMVARLAGASPGPE